MSNLRFIPAKASFVDPVLGAQPPSWGVFDTVEHRFAPFGGGQELAEHAAEKVNEKPELPWSFVDSFVIGDATDAKRFEWTGAVYTEANGQSSTAYGAVDNELGRFYPFSDNAHDPDAEGFVASVASAPEGKYLFASAYTKTN